MKIQQIKISDIKPYTKNAKKHPKKQVEQIAASIKEFGFKQAVVIDKDGVIIVGHGRVEAAKTLGIKEVPAVIADDLTQDQIKAYRLADNKLNESDWEMDLVIEELKDLSPELLDLTGFNNGVDLEGLGEDFSLPDGDKSPFQQMTFTFADDQAEQVKTAIADIKKTNEFKYCETFGNENSNGNALYLIIMQWAEQRK